MSWDDYLTQIYYKDRDGHNPVSDVGIFGIDGSVWASTDCLKCCTSDEIKLLCSDACEFQQHGPVFLGKKWFYVKTVDDCVILQRHGDGGQALVLCKTNKSLIITLTCPGIKAPCIIHRITNIASYLKGIGY